MYNFYYPGANQYLMPSFEPLYNYYNPFFPNCSFKTQNQKQKFQNIRQTELILQQTVIKEENDKEDNNQIKIQAVNESYQQKDDGIIKNFITNKKKLKITPKEKNKGKVIGNYPQIKYRHTYKNFQSNIINKIFSFIWTPDKSKPFVEQILKDKTKVTLYFDYIKVIKKFCQRYINKEYLKDLCNYQIHHIAYKIVLKQGIKLNYFSMDQLSKTIRQLIFIYLNKICCCSILTSKKMRSDIWNQHFQKLRNIKDYLFYNLSAQQYEVRMSSSYEQLYGKNEMTNIQENHPLEEQEEIQLQKLNE